MKTILTLTDVKFEPKFRLDFQRVVPGAFLSLDFRATKVTGGRTEIIDVKGIYRVTGLCFDVETQHLKIESMGLVPTWKAIKNKKGFKRVLKNPVYPRTPI